MRNQIRRSAISVLSNIAEGFEAGTDNQFARYLDIAKGSAGECRAQLYVALDQKYIDESEFEDLKETLLIPKSSTAVNQIFAGLLHPTNLLNFVILKEKNR